MSQQRRRNEAIRLYNELCQQCAQLRAQGFMPRVRLIAHSHGGNVCLNLAAINYVLHSKRVDVGAEIKNTAERASLEAMLERIRSLPSKELVPVMRGSRKFDYVPDYKQLVVDELVLFGTPVQPETAAFLFYDTFKKVYHFYSDKDSIQGLDFVTTRQLFSDQRIPLVRGLKDDCVVKNKDSYVVQARIMVDRSLKQNPKKTTADAHDPCHKDFWFFAWEAPELFFAPLPVVAFTPLLCAAIEQQREKKCDLDVSMLLRKQRVKVSVRPYQGKSVRAKVYLSANAFERVKVHANLWRPVNTGLNHELHAAYKHLTLS